MKDQDQYLYWRDQYARTHCNLIGVKSLLAASVLLNVVFIGALIWNA